MKTVLPSFVWKMSFTNNEAVSKEIITISEKKKINRRRMFSSNRKKNLNNDNTV
jgi:hypothetical protein